MKIQGVLGIALLSVGLGALAATPAPSGHPILGTWSFQLPGTNCSEVYYFRTDGTTLVTSGEEVAESEFVIDDAPSARGFYRMTDKVLKTNGKRDCSGGLSAIDHEATNFIQFHPSRRMLIMCREESLAACFGPLKRLEGEAS